MFRSFDHPQGAHFVYVKRLIILLKVSMMLQHHRNFSMEQNVLPVDDLRIEKCRNVLKVLV